MIPGNWLKKEFEIKINVEPKPYTINEKETNIQYRLKREEPMSRNEGKELKRMNKQVDKELKNEMCPVK
jgi:hypothetical protein